VHAKGRFYTSGDLCRAITGNTLEVRYFQEYILEKYSGIYNL
jgi:carboxypeptidase Taq